MRLFNRVASALDPRNLSVRNIAPNLQAAMSSLQSIARTIAKETATWVDQHRTQAVGGALVMLMLASYAQAAKANDDSCDADVPKAALTLKACADFMTSLFNCPMGEEKKCLLATMPRAAVATGIPLKDLYRSCAALVIDLQAGIAQSSMGHTAKMGPVTVDFNKPLGDQLPSISSVVSPEVPAAITRFLASKGWECYRDVLAPTFEAFLNAAITLHQNGLKAGPSPSPSPRQ